MVLREAQFRGGPQLGIISNLLNSDTEMKGRVIIPILQMRKLMLWKG